MDDWSLLPSRNAVSEPAPNPQTTMTTTTLPARLTRPRQAPPAGADHPCPQTTALDPAGLAWQPINQSGAKPRNPNHHGPHPTPVSRAHTRASSHHTRILDNTRPFMDDTGRLLWNATRRRLIGARVLVRRRSSGARDAGASGLTPERAAVEHAIPRGRPLERRAATRRGQRSEGQPGGGGDGRLAA